MLAIINNKMNYKIETINKNEYYEVVNIWEASVRSTHHFLKEEDIQYFKPLIFNTYLDAVELKCVRNEEGEITGFLGAADQNLEMLLIHPDYRGRQIGKALLNFSIEKMNVRKVDVNEQNDQAVGFYKKCGFETTSCSELDSSGKPYPTLHMELRN
jgi:putative acetyltransferase